MITLTLKVMNNELIKSLVGWTHLKYFTYWPTIMNNNINSDNNDNGNGQFTNSIL